MKKYGIVIFLGIIMVSGWMIGQVFSNRELYSDHLENKLVEEIGQQKITEQEGITEQKEITETEEIARGLKETNKVVPLEVWDGKRIVGVTGENIYTDRIMNGSVYGEVEDFLTFEIDGFQDGSAFVVAGKQNEDNFSGSVWFVNRDGLHRMLEQNVCIPVADAEIPYQDINEKRYIFLNYEKEGRNCGRVFLCQNGNIKEVLKEIFGRKTVNLDGSIECMYWARDGKCMVESDSNTGEIEYRWETYTEKPYRLRFYSDGGIREIGAEVVTKEELLAYTYGERIVQKVDDTYPQGKKQYMIRENGEVNVNIAIEEGNTISFFYMTFQTEEPEREPKCGTGIYLFRMTGEASWQAFLESFAGEKALLPKDISILPWYFDWKRIDAEYMVKIDFEEKDLWKEQGIIGEEFIPEGELLERLSGLVPDYREDWNGKETLDYCKESERVIGSEEYREFYKKVKLIGKTDSFLLYGTNDNEAMILKTPDGVYLWGDLSDSFLYRPYMQLCEEDIDNDGEIELIILGKSSWGGTEKLYLADKDFSGLWKIYNLQFEWYRNELEKHYQVVYIDEFLNFILDGELVGIPVDINENHFNTFSSFQQFQIRKGQIYLYVELNHIGTIGYSIEGNGIRMKLAYLGAGEWNGEEYCYYSRSLENAVTYDAVLKREDVEEVIEIQYDGKLVRECVTTEGLSIPVDVIAVSTQGEEFLIHLEVSYELSEDVNEKEFVVINME